MGYEDQDPTKALAIKFLEDSNDDTPILEKCKTEIDIMGKLDHPNVVK